jgi:hypothetical protein
LHDGISKNIKTGVVLVGVSVVLFLLGILVETPTESARWVVTGFVASVEEENVSAALEYLHDDVILIDDWRGMDQKGHHGVQESLEELYKRHTIQYNTILNTHIFEGTDDVQVELYVFSRISGIGSVPSHWRLLVHEGLDGKWVIYSIDAVEIAGKSYR